MKINCYTTITRNEAFCVIVKIDCEDWIHVSFLEWKEIENDKNIF